MTPGQIAYEAWCDQIEKVADWNNLPRFGQAAWEAAAAAAAAAVLSVGDLSELSDSSKPE